MGLDISVYQNIQRIASLEEETDEMAEEDGVFAIREGRLAPLQTGIYRGERVLSFRAGSYSGYNVFRENLSIKFAGVQPDEIWENPEQYADVPFFELINFSDCGGEIGPEASAALYADFVGHQDAAQSDDAPYFAKCYANWMQAFELAKDGGVVVFW